MGLLSAFGVGGGKVSVQLANARTSVGGLVEGAVVFAAGKRAQNVARITVRLVATRVAGGVARDGVASAPQASRDVVPAQTIGGPFTAQPGQSGQFAFGLPVPPDAHGSQPDVLSYHVIASADIDGEIDPGASVEVFVAGPTNAPMVPAGMYNPGVPVGAYGKGDAGYQAASFAQGNETKDAAFAKSAVGVGSRCVAQGPDGNWYPGQVVAMEQGMYAVQWDDKALGSAAWVGATQVMPG